jgi:diaminopimelate epimerase
MKKIPFFKMNGSGNDFIIINNQERVVEENINLSVKDFVIKVCKRGLSVGADGLILIEKDDECNFRWRFFNNDGSEVEMCGNGARCAARFAYLNNIAPIEMKFRTLAGVIKAEITGINSVKAQLTMPTDYRENIKLDGIDMEASFINTGVPHVVYFVDDVDSVDVEKLGSKTRYHKYFEPEGTNVNFVEVLDTNKIKIRTYERGVEGETLACGTGATAAALISILKGKVFAPTSVKTRSGNILNVYVEAEGNEIQGVFLEGDATLTYIGTMTDEAWMY